MDLLFRRYANPFTLLDAYLKQKRLIEFVNSLLDIVIEEKTYDVWLHKVYDKSYVEFKSDLKAMQDNINVSDEQLEATIKRSHDMLNNFDPYLKGE